MLGGSASAKPPIAARDQTIGDRCFGPEGDLITRTHTERVSPRHIQGKSPVQAPAMASRTPPLLGRNNIREWSGQQAGTISAVGVKRSGTKCLGATWTHEAVARRQLHGACRG